MKTSGGAPNVWPGYVAAVAGLGISLLLLIAVLGLGIFQIGASIHDKVIKGFKPNMGNDTKLISPVGENNPRKIAEEIKSTPVKDTDNHDVKRDPIDNEVANIFPVLKGMDYVNSPDNSSDKLIEEIHRNNSLHQKLSPELGGKTQEVISKNKNREDVDILFRFSNGIYKLNREAKKKSQSIIEKHLSGYKVIVSTSASIDTESSSRNAYIRILAVRNHLLDMGFNRENVIIKLNPAASDASKPNEVNVKFSAVAAE